MANFRDFSRYLQDYCSYTTSLPSFDDLRKGLQPEEKIFSHDSNIEFITKLHIPEHLKDQKTRETRRIAAHVWGGNEEICRVFNQGEIVSLEEISYADNEPIKVAIKFPGEIEKVFYAKPSTETNERRFFGLELENILSPYKYSYSIGKGIFEDEILGCLGSEVSERTKKSKEYQEELLRLDTRSKIMLVGDMHDCNYVVLKKNTGTEKKYCIRTIDPEKLFDTAKLEDRFIPELLPTNKLTELIGQERYKTIIILEKEGMRKRYLENEERLNKLLTLIGSSDECNKFLPEVSNMLTEHYSKQKNIRAEKFYNTENIGILLGMHLREQLSI